MNQHLIKIFKDMSDLTAPECANVCRVPHSCCSPEYCDMAEDWANEHAEKLPPRTNHPTLKFMGPNGCILEPHLRPICTVHTCAINGLGMKLGDQGWTDRYFELRNQIEEELFRG